MEVKLRLRPLLPKQRAFLESWAKFRAYVGGVGSGKTVALAADNFFESLEYPDNRGLIVAPTFGMLHDNVLPVLEAVYPPEALWEGSWERAYNKTHKDLRFINGSLTSLRSADEPQKFLGQTIGHAHLDEAGLMPEELFIQLRGRLRKPGVRLTLTLGSNPDSKASWMYHYFVKRVADDGDKNTYELFTAPTTENRYLPKEYIDDLLKMPAEWRDRYVYGLFTNFEGQVYSDLNPRIHYVEPADFHRVYGPKVPEWWTFGGTIDPGENAPTAAWLKFRDEQGVSWYVDRYYEARRVTSQHVEAIKGRIQGWGKKPETTDLVIDPSATARRVEGASIVGTYYQHQLYPRPAESCRGDGRVWWGINVVKQRLFPDPAKLHPILKEPGCPGILFVLYPGVREGLDLFEGYRWMPTRLGANSLEKPVKYKDHDADAIRYRECEDLPVAEAPAERMRRQMRENAKLAALDPMTGFGLM